MRVCFIFIDFGRKFQLSIYPHFANLSAILPIPLHLLFGNKSNIMRHVKCKWHRVAGKFKE
jgi:hypothetical protein